MNSSIGHKHPISQMIAEINSIFTDIGFVFTEGPEVETEEYNFDRLNFPTNHPARDLQDTFWLDSQQAKVPTVLRTHTSPVQVRYLEKHQADLPVRIIVPGKVFRNEATDSTHEVQFHQLEGLYVDEGIGLGHMKGVLEHFFKQFLADDVQIRFRPSFFPFVEPGVEVDMRVQVTSSQLSGRWIEVMGAGMVHPNVLLSAGVDASRYSGFAFGMGLDRLGVMKFGIDDVRNFYNGDLRFNNQF